MGKVAPSQVAPKPRQERPSHAKLLLVNSLQVVTLWPAVLTAPIRLLFPRRPPRVPGVPAHEPGHHTALPGPRHCTAPAAPRTSAAPEPNSDRALVCARPQEQRISTVHFSRVRDSRQYNDRALLLLTGGKNVPGELERGKESDNNPLVHGIAGYANNGDGGVTKRRGGEPRTRSRGPGRTGPESAAGPRDSRTSHCTTFRNIVVEGGTSVHPAMAGPVSSGS